MQPHRTFVGAAALLSQLDIGKYPRFRKRSPLEVDSRLTAYDAMRAVAPDQPASGYGMFSIAPAHSGFDAFAILGRPDELMIPAHLAAKLGQPAAQLSFDLRLRYQQRPERVLATLGFNDESGQEPLARPDIGRVSMHRALRQIAERIESSEDFTAARLEAERARGRRRADRLVDDLHRDSAAAKIAGQGQSGRAGAFSNAPPAVDLQHHPS